MDLIKTLDVLRRFTDTAIITPDITYFGYNRFIGSAKMENIEHEIGLYKNIDTLMRLIGFFDNPIISYDDRLKIIKIKEKDNDTKEAQFITSDTDTIKSIMTNDEIKRQFEMTQAANVVAKFEIDQKLLNNIKKMDQIVLKASLIIKADPKIVLKVSSLELFNCETHSYKVETDEVADKDFVISLPLEGIVNIPNDDYKVEIVYSSKADAYRIVLTNSSNELSFIAPCDIVE